MSSQPNPSHQRADRILDAAGELLLRLGYRKVTIEDIAGQADVGKGTVYLHWRSKDQLFEALLLRESIGLTEELIDRVRADPAELIPHRFVRASFLASHARPLVTALFTSGSEVLGRLASRTRRDQELVANERYYSLMTEHGLFRDDIPNLKYAVQATGLGFYLLDNFDPGAEALTPEAKADALAHTVRHAFEPATSPDPAAVAVAAAELCDLFEDVLAEFRTWIYSPDSA